MSKSKWKPIIKVVACWYWRNGMPIDYVSLEVKSFKSRKEALQAKKRIEKILTTNEKGN